MAQDLNHTRFYVVVGCIVFLALITLGGWCSREDAIQDRLNYRTCVQGGGSVELCRPLLNNDR